MNAIKEIERFQKDRLLDKQPFDLTNESLNILEEFLELNKYSDYELNSSDLDDEHDLSGEIQ